MPNMLVVTLTASSVMLISSDSGTAWISAREA
jgi:hypothetical protein